MGTFLSVIFFIIFGFYLLGLIGRLILSLFIRKTQRDFEKGKGPFTRTYSWGTGGRQSQNRQPKAQPEGEITVEYREATEKKVSKQVGDYVEFEEIEENEK